MENSHSKTSQNVNQTSKTEWNSKLNNELLTLLHKTQLSDKPEFQTSFEKRVFLSVSDQKEMGSAGEQPISDSLTDWNEKEGVKYLPQTLNYEFAFLKNDSTQSMKLVENQSLISGEYGSKNPNFSA